MGRGAACAGLSAGLTCVGRAASSRRAELCLPRAFRVPALLRHQESGGGDGQAGVTKEASPAADLAVAMSEVLLEVLAIALDAPAHRGFEHHALDGHVLGQRGQPVRRRLLVALGPFDERPRLRPQCVARVVTLRRSHPDPGKARAQGDVAAFRHTTVRHCPARQCVRPFLHRLWPLVCGLTRALPRGHLAASAVGRRRQRCVPGRPDSDLARCAHHAGQPRFAQALAERGLRPVPRIGQHAVPGCALVEQLLDLRQRPRRLGRKGHGLGHARLLAPDLVPAPLLGQVQPPCHRQAASLRCERDTRRDLAVVLVAQHAARLVCNAHRVRALPGKSGRRRR